jgi:septum formation protein
MAPTTPSRPLILASTSRYRRELLARLNLSFQVHAPEVNETPRPGEAPAALAERLAAEKAQALALRYPQAIIIGSDQVADFNGLALGKPGTHAKATEQLRAMRGQAVLFQTAVAVVCTEQHFQASILVTVRVHFRQLSDAHIEHYLRTEQPYDCAGSAKSEGLGIALLQSIDSSDPTALIGLPLIATCQLLRQAGMEVLQA